MRVEAKLEDLGLVLPKPMRVPQGRLTGWRFAKKQASTCEYS